MQGVKGSLLEQRFIIIFPDLVYKNILTNLWNTR